MSCKHRLPSFRTTCIGVGIAYCVLAGSLFARGLAASMAEFGVSEVLLEAPHYLDALLWVYSHMIVLGLVIAVIGRFAEAPALKLWSARLLFLVHVYYLYLDLRTSDSALGDGLYQGPSSVIPALIAGIIMLLFLHLSLCTSARDR